MFFLGFTISGFIAPILGDTFGRKKTFVIARLLAAIIFIILVLLPGGVGNYASTTGIMVLLFLIGLLNNISVLIGYLYFCEFAPELSGKTMGTMWNMQEGAIIIWLTLYYWFVSKNWKWPVLFGGIGMIIGATVIHFYLPESPKWLYEKKRFREVQKTFK